MIVPAHLAISHRHTDLRGDSTLHVVAAVSNPARYQSRYRLARGFIEEMRATPNVKLYVAEAAFGDRHHEVTESSVCGPEADRIDHHPRCLQVRTKSEIWNKEALLGLTEERLLPRDWRYIAWVDADVTFADPRWALETIHQLQHHAVVQPWRQALDLGPHGEVMKVFESFGYKCQTGGQRFAGQPAHYSSAGHPGYAMACTRAWWEAVGGLPEFAILGSGDRHVAFGCVGEGGRSVAWGAKRGVAEKIPGYVRTVEAYGKRAHAATGPAGVGYTEGVLSHHYHGSKAARGYSSRWEILAKHGFDPDTDLTKDDQGLIQLVGKPELDYEISKYNRARCEDG